MFVIRERRWPARPRAAAGPCIRVGIGPSPLRSAAGLCVRLGIRSSPARCAARSCIRLGVGASPSSDGGTDIGNDVATLDVVVKRTNWGGFVIRVSDCVREILEIVIVRVILMMFGCVEWRFGVIVILFIGFVICVVVGVIRLLRAPAAATVSSGIDFFVGEPVFMNWGWLIYA